MTETPQGIETRIDRAESALGDDHEEMPARRLYLAHLKAVHEGRPGDAERAWAAYEERLAAAADAETDTEEPDDVE